MNNKKNICIYFFGILLSLFMSCLRAGNSYPQVNMMKASFTDCLMFQGTKNIIGLDPDTDKIKIDLLFDHYVLCGDTTPDGNLLAADIGKSVGDYGGRLLLIDKKGKIVKGVQALQNPGKVGLVGDYVFSDSVGYYEDGYTAYDLFSLSTFGKVLEDKTLNHFVANDKSWISGDYAYIGIRPNEAFFGRRSLIQRLNLRTLEKTDLTYFTDRHPYYYFNCAIVGHFLVISYIQACEIEVFDLDTGSSVSFIDLKKIIKDIAEDPYVIFTGQTMDSSFRLERPVNDDNRMYFHIMPNRPEALYQALVTLDTQTWSIASVMPLEKNIILCAVDLCYVRNGKAYYCNHESIFIYDINSGVFLKEIKIS